MADAAALSKLVKRPVAHGYLFPSALNFGQWYKMLSIVRKKKESDKHDGEGSATKHREWKKKTAFDIKGVSLYYTLEVGNMVTRIISRKAHYVNISEEGMHFWRKGLPYRDVVARVSNNSHGKVSTVRTWRTNEIDGIALLSGT